MTWTDLLTGIAAACLGGLAGLLLAAGAFVAAGAAFSPGTTPAELLARIAA
ncbi:MAG: hypothetical protein JO290_11900 [Sphingomonadaceae bacterium]|nr:hypothetical protein [Sphingomonadaceae bacterium]